MQIDVIPHTEQQKKNPNWHCEVRMRKTARISGS